MAHEISLLDTIVTQAGTARAWHGLDVQADLNGLSVSEGAKQAGLDHEVRVIPLTRIDTGEETGLFGVYSDKNPEIFRTVTERFTPILPQEFYGWGHKTAQLINGALSSAGTLKGTRHGFVCVELPDSTMEIGNGDKLSRYISFNISWDGSYAISAMLWDKRQVCANTTPSAATVDALGSNVLFYEKNHRSLDKAAEAVANQLQLVKAEHLAKQDAVYQKLAATEFADNLDRLRFANLMADGAKVLDRIINMTVEQSKGSFLDQCMVATIDRAAWEAVRVDQKNTKAQSILYQTVYGQGQDTDTARDTAWGALNGLTYWQNHVAGDDGGKGRKTTDEGRREKVLFGKYNQDVQNATLLLSAIANTR